MKKLFVVAFALALTAGPALAQSKTVTGQLIDVACGTENGMTAAKAKEHDKACLEMKDCDESGYAVIADDGDVLLKFDAKGNELARKLVAATEKINDWKVTVKGTVNGETIAVDTLTLDK